MDPSLTIVLLGDTGVGKSSSGNTILGRAAFDSRQAFRSVTTQISEATETVFGKQISVIDTPGILVYEREIQTWCQELLRSQRPCLFLVVFRVGPISREQGRVLMAVHRVLGPEFLQCHVLFTGGDALQDRSLEDFLFDDEENSSQLSGFSGRCHLFDNETGGQEQVRELLLKTGHLRLDSPAEALGARRLVLLGPLGGGRSSSGNTILGSEQFRSGCDFDAVSTEAVSRSAMVEGRQVTVVDTPGFTDRVQSPDQLFQQILSSVLQADPGPHAFIIVVRIGIITTESIKLFQLLQSLFRSDAFRFSMVLFTHGDELKGQSIDDLIRSNGHVSDLVSMCGGGYCVFNNRDRRNREQVRHFLNRVDEMVTANDGQHLSSSRFRKADPGSFVGKITQFLKRHYKIIGSVTVVLSVIFFIYNLKSQGVESSLTTPKPLENAGA